MRGLVLLNTFSMLDCDFIGLAWESDTFQKKHARVLKTIEVMTNPWRFTGDSLIDPNQLSDESIAISIMDFQEWWRY
jgi:hypothetical protein